MVRILEFDSEDCGSNPYLVTNEVSIRHPRRIVLLRQLSFNGRTSDFSESAGSSPVNYCTLFAFYPYLIHYLIAQLEEQLSSKQQVASSILAEITNRCRREEVHRNNYVLRRAYRILKQMRLEPLNQPKLFFQNGVCISSMLSFRFLPCILD